MCADIACASYLWEGSQVKKPHPTSQDFLIPGPLAKCPPGPPRQRGKGILCHRPRNNHPIPVGFSKLPSAVAFHYHLFIRAGAAAPAISLTAPCLGTCGVAHQLLHNAWLPLQGPTGALPYYSVRGHSAHTVCQASRWPLSKRYPIPRPTVSITVPVLQRSQRRAVNHLSK